MKDQENININRITTNGSMMMAILRDGNLELINNFYDVGGDLFNIYPIRYGTNPKKIRKGINLYVRIFCFVFLNEDQNCIDYILKYIPNEKLINNLSVMAMLVVAENIKMMEYMIDKRYILVEYLRKEASPILDYAIFNNKVLAFTYLINNVFRPKPKSKLYKSILRNIIYTRNEEMHEALLSLDNINPVKNYNLVGQIIYVIKGFIGLIRIGFYKIKLKSFISDKTQSFEGSLSKEKSESPYFWLYVFIYICFLVIVLKMTL